MATTTPLSISQQELTNFNQFYSRLSDIDRIVLDDLIHAASDNFIAVDRPEYYPTYDALLLTLLIQEHREVRRLTHLVEELLASTGSQDPQ
ncbi:MAG: hypothetical protein ACM3PY_11500 [Omnitrophica WOR_2 bacterium]